MGITTLVFIIAFFTGAAADAAIPSSRTIAGRLVKNSGSGIYSIEQEVQFRTNSSELLTLRERWIIENGEKMRLLVTGPATGRSPSRFDVVYHEGKRTAPDLQGSLRTTPIGPEFIEVFSHVRSSKTFLDALVRSGIVPASFLRERQRFSANPPRYIPEPRVRLGRTSGVVSYVFGEATAVDAKKQSPGVWIEQDAFLLRRLRFPSEAELTADGFTLFPKGLRLARERTLSWGSNFASIRVLSAKSLTAEESQKLLSPESLTSADAQAARLPDEAQVKEFYLRFR